MDHLPAKEISLRFTLSTSEKSHGSNELKDRKLSLQSKAKHKALLIFSSRVVTDHVSSGLFII